MIASSSIQAIVLTHMLQFSLAITAVAVVIWMAGRRWPHITFLVCMLALAKCLVPPVITSPAGVFTRYAGLAFSPSFSQMESRQIVEFKKVASAAPESSLAQMYHDALSTAGASAPSAFDWLVLLFYAWLIGVSMVFGRAVWQYVKLVRLVRRANPAPAHLEAMAESARRELGLERRVRVLVSDEDYGPASIGLWNPKLILPRHMVTHWTERLLRPVLTHELVHFRRGDIVWGYLQFTAQIVWWFHPLVWWLGRRAHILCERCCDDEVIATKGCTAADYAESLVRVLEMKSSLRTVPLCNAISPAEVTGQRLERLMSRCGNYSKNTSRTSWTVAILLAALIIPGMQWANGQEKNSKKDKEIEYRAKINVAIEKGQWEEAISMLKPIVESDPKNGGAVFYLGYALHASGDLDEALIYHRRAASFPNLKPISLYNWACALSLKGETTEALEKLTAALDSGFVHATDLRDDPDLESLFGTKEFKKLLTRTKKMQQTNKILRQFDFWLGEWDVVDANGEKVGSNKITSSDHGHVLTEKWTSSGGTTGTSINFFHPSDQKWHQTWVDAHGGVIEYVGEFKDGKMQFDGKLFSALGEQTRSRMTFTPNDDGSVEQFIENSKDGGKTWSVYFRGTYQRRPQATSNELTDV